jgi:hypothetical protein
MQRRQRLSKVSQFAGLSFLTFSSSDAEEQVIKKKLKIMVKSAWGSDDPTRAAFPFSHGLALAEAGHDVQIFLTGHLSDAEVDCRSNYARGLATPDRNF